MLGPRALVLVGALAVAGNTAANIPPARIAAGTPDLLSSLLSQLRFPIPEGEALAQSTNLSFKTRCGESVRPGASADVMLRVICC